MAMKKKFLALAMAAAIALPASSAYAANQVITGDNSKELDASVTVTGNVTNKNGQVAAGQIQVEVPTAMAFTVNKDGKFTAAQAYTITNQSVDPVSLTVDSFTESNPSGDIRVVKLDELADPSAEPRSTVAMSITGNTGKTVDLAKVRDGLELSDNKKVLKINANSQGSLTLNGVAGTAADNVDTTAISENFTLVFKIKKDTI